MSPNHQLVMKGGGLFNWFMDFFDYIVGYKPEEREFRRNLRGSRKRFRKEYKDHTIEDEAVLGGARKKRRTLKRRKV